jgi:hypothetical protein
MVSTAGGRLAEIEVRHHPRRFGTSKYGLSRIYKVCLDLIAVKTILVFNRRPLLWFAGSATLAVALAGLSFVAALYHALTEGAASAVVFMGLSLLFGSLTVYLAMIGVIGSLAHRHVRAEPETPRLAPLVSQAMEST